MEQNDIFYKFHFCENFILMDKFSNEQLLFLNNPIIIFIESLLSYGETVAELT